GGADDRNAESVAPSVSDPRPLHEKAPAPAMSRTPRSAEPPRERASILLVDDRPDKHVVYRSILEELGQNLVSARSGEEALREVLKSEFAVILLDVNMPGMDGLETAAMIRSRKRSSHVPII